MTNKSKKILSEISPGELLDKISILEIKLEKVKDRAKEVGQTEKTPLIIEDFEIKDGKLKFKKGTKPYSHKKKKYKYKKG